VKRLDSRISSVSYGQPVWHEAGAVLPIALCVLSPLIGAGQCDAAHLAEGRGLFVHDSRRSVAGSISLGFSNLTAFKPAGKNEREQGEWSGSGGAVEVTKIARRVRVERAQSRDDMYSVLYLTGASELEEWKPDAGGAVGWRGLGAQRLRRTPSGPSDSSNGPHGCHRSERGLPLCPGVLSSPSFTYCTSSVNVQADCHDRCVSMNHFWIQEAKPLCGLHDERGPSKMRGTPSHSLGLPALRLVTELQRADWLLGCWSSVSHIGLGSHKVNGVPSGAD